MRLEKEKEERRAKYWVLIRNMIEQVKIVSNDKFPLNKEAIFDRSLFPTEAYQHGEVKDFLRAVKSGDVLEAHKMIHIDPTIVF